MHTFSKFINPDDFVGFFEKPLTEGVRPWISRTYAHGPLMHVEAEARGVVYVPWRGEWALVLQPMTPWSTQGNYLFWVSRPNDTASRPYHKLLCRTFKGRKCRVSQVFANRRRPVLRTLLEFSLREGINSTYVSKNSSRIINRKGQQVCRGRETMGARHEEKRMNYDGQWGERVALSRVTEIIHATPIKWDRIVVRNCQEMGPPGHENGFVPSLVPTRIRFDRLRSCTMLLLGLDQRCYQKSASFVAARTLQRPESFALDLASLRVDGEQAGFELLRGHATILRARRRSVGPSCTACPVLTSGNISTKKALKGWKCGSAVMGGKETEREQRASGLP
jgi:hypothetical protein